MFCLGRNRRCNSTATSYPAPFCQTPVPSKPSYPVQQNLSQSSSSHHNASLSCPISYYPENVYGQGLESTMDRFDRRVTDALDGTRHYNQVRDPSIPLPPGVVTVQILQPTAPPYPSIYPEAREYPQNPHFQQQNLYPKLSDTHY